MGQEYYCNDVWGREEDRRRGEPYDRRVTCESDDVTRWTVPLSSHVSAPRFDLLMRSKVPRAAGLAAPPICFAIRAPSCFFFNPNKLLFFPDAGDNPNSGRRADELGSRGRVGFEGWEGRKKGEFAGLRGMVVGGGGPEVGGGSGGRRGAGGAAGAAGLEEGGGPASVVGASRRRQLEEEGGEEGGEGGGGGW
ncbi:hypothetical protein OsJ_24779 [Oryza sativa Japonica Group]|uniref:Uncharacterized protein n=1 Tax=Oryza sativa subsp. japonica TaxID=39947 RepID=A3BL93_ORYSJ|nr:hypothetical protein OsJ_24779 [Oryza sativa Japonica Group]